MSDPKLPLNDVGDTRDGVSVVIPAYKSAEGLAELCEQITEHVRPLARRFEIILVDDGSGDETWDTIYALSQRLPQVKGVALLRNFGQHNALLAGLRAARLPIVVTMDDDLQNPPSEIETLLDALTDDVDLVYGVPARERQTLVRNAASRTTKWMMSSALGPDVHPRASAFRAFRRQIVSAWDSVNDPAISIDVLLTWGTSRMTAVEVDHHSRKIGRSGYSFRRLMRHALTMITGYSVRPLRIAGGIGLLVAAFGFLLFVFVIVRYVLGDTPVQGFTFLAAALTLFSGVQLMTLGVIGEYLGRVHFRTMGKPAYVIRAQTPTVAQAATADNEVAPS